MDGLMMDYQLTVDSILHRAEQYYGNREIVTRMPDKSWHRYDYGSLATRARKLALALQKLGIKEGDRVGTLCWNNYRHYEAYFAIPIIGCVLHTLNLRLHSDDLTYIVNDADDKAIIADESLLPLLDHFKDKINTEHIIVVSDSGKVPAGCHDYETLLAGVDVKDYVQPSIDENAGAAMCYTSGTTGRPKGVLYSHRGMVLHSICAALPGVMGIKDHDVVLPVVPMFHANSWGIPYTAATVGAKMVFPGPHLDGPSLLDAFATEKVTFTAGVPTIWMGILQELEKNADKYDISALKTLVVGGSAVPMSMIKAFDKFGLEIVQAWGMTEMTPLGTVSRLKTDLLEADDETKYEYRAKQGVAAPLVEVRARGDEGLVPWDGKQMGELEVRGPWIAKAYYNRPDAEDRFTEDGWFKTGDIVTIDELGYVKIQDRTKDLVKSGGEWISSVDLENLIMGHPDVAEAAVIAIPHPKWDERPLAAVVKKDGANLTADDLREYLSDKVAKWWIPDAFEFIDEIPKTSVGKFRKTALREQFEGYQLPS